MRILLPVFAAVFILATSGLIDSQTAVADDEADEIDYCSCVNEPITTDAKAQICGNLMESMTPEESATRTFECRATLPVPDGGPDLCFCLRTTTTDPALAQACQALIPQNITPAELAAKMVECAK